MASEFGGLAKKPMMQHWEQQNTIWQMKRMRMTRPSVEYVCSSLKFATIIVPFVLSKGRPEYLLGVSLRAANWP